MPRWSGAIVLIAVLSASPGQAGERPTVELAGGFSALASGSCCLPTTGSVPVGWFAGVGLTATDWLSIVGQIGADYLTLQAHPPYPFAPFPESHSRTQAWFAGPRISHPLTNRIMMFGQAVFGHARRDVTSYVPALGGNVRGGYSHFAWQPGAGVDLSLTSSLQLRLTGDYRLTPLDGLVNASAIAQPRFGIGFVYRR